MGVPLRRKILSLSPRGCPYALVNPYALRGCPYAIWGVPKPRGGATP